MSVWKPLFHLRVLDWFNWCYFVIYYSCNCCCCCYYYYYYYYCDYYKEYYYYHHQHQPLHFKSAPGTKIYMWSCLVCVGLRTDPSVRRLLNYVFNPLNAELNPICHLLSLLGAHHILHVSRIRVNTPTKYTHNKRYALTLILLTWRIWWANNASKWQMGFNSAFKGLIITFPPTCFGTYCAIYR